MKQNFTLKGLIFSWAIISVFLGSLCFTYASEGEDIPKQTDAGEIRSLSKLEGRVSLENIEGQECLFLTTKEGRSYLLKGKLAEEKIRPLEALENKQLVIAGLPDNNQVEKIIIKRDYDQKTKEVTREGYVVRYTDFLVLYIEKVEEAKGGISLVKERYDKPLPLSFMPAELRRVRGKVLVSNSRSPIPTVEIKDLEYKRPNTTIIITSETSMLKVVEGKAMQVTKRTLKQGDNVEVWYEQKNYQNIARMVSILDKN